MPRLFIILLFSILPHFSAFATTQIESFNSTFTKAVRGEINAQFKLGEMYRIGKEVKKNMSEAFYWYSKAAKQGDVRSVYYVGLAYVKGNGVKQNIDKGMELLTTASKKDYANASIALGELHEHSKYVKQDYAEALQWYKKAQRQGAKIAHKKIKHVKYHQEKVRRDSEKAKQKKKKAKLAKKVTKPVVPAVTKVLLKGGWKKQNKSAEIFPSSVTSCKSAGDTIECESDAMTRKIGLVDIHYITKAVMFDLSDENEFQVSYRNKVIKVNAPNEAANAAELPLQLGWQKTLHSLNCKLVNDKTLTCEKDKIRTVKFNR